MENTKLAMGGGSINGGHVTFLYFVHILLQLSLFIFLFLLVQVVRTRGNCWIWLKQMISRKGNLRQLVVVSCLVWKGRVGTPYRGTKLDDKKVMPP